MQIKNLCVTGLETYDHDGICGVYIKWDANIGWGEYELAFVDGKLKGCSELMDTEEDKSFLKMLFDAILEEVEIVG